MSVYEEKHENKIRNNFTKYGVFGGWIKLFIFFYISK